MKKIILISILLLLYGTFLPAQEIKQNVEERLQAFFKEYTTNTVNIGTCKLDSFRIDFRKKRLLIYTNVLAHGWRHSTVWAGIVMVNG